MRQLTPKIAFLPWRFYLLLVVILFIILGLVARVFTLAVIERPFLLKQGNVRAIRFMDEPAFRGMITDRNGYPLAVSAPVYSVWVNPVVFSPDSKSIKHLAGLLNLKKSQLQKLIQTNKKKSREFVYLKRGISPEKADQVKLLHLTGLYLQHDYKRFYPEGEVAAHVIGFTNVDDKGQEGVELAYNQWLAGAPGKKLVVRDRLGRVITNLQTFQEQQAGHDLTLSIDHRIQFIAYRALAEGVEANQADSGSVIVLDPQSGEILAMVNQPSYNPNNIAKQNRNNFRNRAVTDIFEPGSTIKAFSIATALSSGKFHPDTVIDTYPGWMRVGRHVVRDEKNNGSLSITQILQLSSNMGVSKIILSLPPGSLWNLLHRSGFGEITGTGFPGEQSGKLVKPHPKDAFGRAVLSFGYGMSITALQLAHAYAILGNNGVKTPVSLLRVDSPPAGEQVLDPATTKQMLMLLESVVAKEGTGHAAHVPGYRVAGKTGTSWMIGPNGYQKHHYSSSFVGIAPVTHPRLVVAVVIHNPKGKNYYGAEVSAPVFEKIMEQSLRTLDISPDQPRG